MKNVGMISCYENVWFGTSFVFYSPYMIMNGGLYCKECVMDYHFLESSMSMMNNIIHGK